MAARSTRGPGGGRTGGRRPAARKGGGRGAASSGCLMTVVAVGLVLGMSLILTPLATRVWTAEIVPAANRVHFGDGLVVALALAGFGLYLATSVLFVRRRAISPAGSVPVLRGAGTSSRSGVSVLDVARGEPRSEGTAAGVPTSPGPTPAATSFSGGCRYCICDKATCDADDTGQHCIDSRCAACLDGCPDDGCGWPATTNSQPVASGLGLTAAEATRASASAVMTAVAVPRGAAADGSGVDSPAGPAPRPAEGRATGRGVTPTRRAA